MEIIKFGGYETNDLFRLLDYCRDKKKEDLKKGKITVEMFNWDNEKITTIQMRLLGKEPHEMIIRQNKAIRERYNEQKAEEKRNNK